MKDTIKDIMIKNVFTCSPETTLQNAAIKMKKEKIGCLLVIKNNFPIGIVTERDMTFKAITNKLDSQKISVKKIMTTKLKTISPEEKIYTASIILEKFKIKRLPVIKNNKLAGIITQTNLIKHFTKMRSNLAIDKFKEKIKSVK